mgnify:CR=1 FL=1
MKVPLSIIIMDMKNLYSLPENSHKAFEIYTRDIRMAGIQAETKNLASILVIDSVDSLSSLSGIAARTFFDMSSCRSIDILNADDLPSR